MLKNLLTIGLIALIGLVALKVVFGLLGPLVSLLLWLLGAAIKVALVGVFGMSACAGGGRFVGSAG